MSWWLRKEADMTKLLMRDFKVMREDRPDTFEVVFHGVEMTPYEGGIWRIRVNIPPEYPFEPPNCVLSGLICSECLYWDHFDHGWSSTDDDFVTIFEYWIPRLLIDPNPICPENHDAGELFTHDEREFKQLVREFCEMFANVEGMLSESSSGDKESGSEESTSEE